MADKKKGAKKASAKDAKKSTSASPMRDLDLLDAKIANVKGGQKKNIRQKRT